MQTARALFATVVRPPFVRVRRALANAMFDRRYGVDTDGEASPTDLDSLREKAAATRLPGLLSLRRILPPREVSEHDVFIDLGSGKGRAVLQAALHYPFRTAYGVELSELLHEIAEGNLQRIRRRLRCQDVRLVRSDVLHFYIPTDVTVVFLNNPFQGQVFATVVDRLLDSIDSNPRTLRIVYGNPVEEATLLRTGRAQLVRQLRGWRPGQEWWRSNSCRLYTLS